MNVEHFQPTFSGDEGMPCSRREPQKVAGIQAVLLGF
jgi:hypothetical protein